MNKFYSTVLVAAAAIFAPAVAEAATPADVTITVGGTTGYWCRGNNTTRYTGTSAVGRWISNANDPGLMMDMWILGDTWANNCTPTTEAKVLPHSFNRGGCVYKLHPAAGYYISHVSFDIKALNTSYSSSVTLGNQTVTTTTTPQSVQASFSYGQEVSFTMTIQNNTETANKVHAHEITNFLVTLSPITTATITYEWKTESGAHLTTPVTVQTPGGQAVTVNQEAKTFDHYTLVSTSALNGTSITPEPNTNTKITSIYHDERNVIPGVKSLAYSVSAIEAGKTYALFSQHATSTDRDAFRYVRNDNKIYGKPVANLTDETPYFTWVIENADTEGQYKFKNNGNDWYIAPMVHDTQASVSQTAGTFIIEPHPSDPTKFRISSATNNNIRWDGNGANSGYSMNGWEGAGNKITPYEYVIDPYFSVTIEQVRYDSRGNGADENVVVSSTKHLVKAGSDFTLPEIPATVSGEGYADNEYKYSEGADDLTNIQGHKVVKHFYDVRTGVNAISADSKAAVIFDLMGRKLDNASKPGIYVINGKKVVIK